MTTAKRNLYALAERLGVLVCDIQRMPLEEFYNWIEFFTVVKVIEDEVTSDADLLTAFGMSG